MINYKNKKNNKIKMFKFKNNNLSKKKLIFQRRVKKLIKYIHFNNGKVY